MSLIVTLIALASFHADIRVILIEIPVDCSCVYSILCFV